MGATTTDRNTKMYGYSQRAAGEWPVLNATKIPAGVLVARNTSGYAASASDAVSLTFSGVSKEQADNLLGVAGALKVRVHRGGVFNFVDGSAAMTAADIGKQAYVSDNQTIVLTGTGHSLKCGRIFDVPGDGTVWIEIDLDVDANTATS